MTPEERARAGQAEASAPEPGPIGHGEPLMTGGVAERFRLLRQDLSGYGGADGEASIELLRGL